MKANETKNRGIKICLLIITSSLVFSNTVLKAAPTLTVTLSGTNVSCNGGQDGSITANVIDGTPPYTYRWSNHETTQSISQLSQGYYSCYVKDGNNQETTVEITLTEPDPLQLLSMTPYTYSNGYNTSCYYCIDGAINVSIEGGVPPYTYLWNDGVTTQNRTQLKPVGYQLSVTDANGCQLNEGLNVTIVNPESNDWTSSGNSNANSNSFIGTLTSVDFVLKSSNIEALRLKTNQDAIFAGRIGLGTTSPSEKFEVSGGNVKFGQNLRIVGNHYIDGNMGIGTTSPTEKFEVSGGNVKFGGDAKIVGNTEIGGDLRLTGLSGTEPNYLGVDNDGKLVKVTKNDIISSVYGSLDCATEVSTTSTANPPHWSTNLMSITTPQQSSLLYYPEILSCFNIGIKKTHADYDLDVTGIGSFSDKLFVGNKLGIGTLNPTNNMHIKSDNPSILLQDDANSTGHIDEVRMKITAANGFARIVSDKGIALFVNSDHDTDSDTDENCFRIVKDDSCFCSSPVDLFKIKYDGTAYCNKLIVQLTSTASGFPDYVFDKNYKLKPLVDVENYIKINKHLPEVPTANEVKQSGIDAEEMFKIQMKKIEELTLYIIQQQKEIEGLKSKIK